MATAEPPQLPYARDPNSYSAHYQNSSHTNAYAYSNNAGGYGAYGQGSVHAAGSHAQHQMQQYHQQQAYAQQQPQAQYDGYPQPYGSNGYHLGPDGQMYEDMHDMAMQEEAVEEEENGAALQYWTAPRHRVGAKDKGKGREEEYCMFRLYGSSCRACRVVCFRSDCQKGVLIHSAMAPKVPVKDHWRRHVHLPQHRGRPARCRQDEPMCKDGDMDRSGEHAQYKSHRADRSE